MHKLLGERWQAWGAAESFAGSLSRCAAAAIQEDGTLETLLADTTALGDVLEALCGLTRKREAEADVRSCLAESIEMLVRQPVDCHCMCCSPSPGHVQVLSVRSVYDAWKVTSALGLLTHRSARSVARRCCGS